MRATYVWRDGKLIPKHLAPPRTPKGPRSMMAFPAVISDKLWDVQSMSDGKIYDSKSELRRSYRERGVIEVGNDAPCELPSSAKPWAPARGDVELAYRMVAGGYKPNVAPLGDAPNVDSPFDLAEAGADERQPTD